LKPISNVLNPSVWVSGRKEKKLDPVARNTIMTNLSEVFLPVKVYLGSTQLKVSEITSLQIGDVIQLNTPVNKKLTMQIANNNLFQVMIGKMGNRMAVRIDSVIRSQTDSVI
jgi:flagellar motor switch protein FliM